MDTLYSEVLIAEDKLAATLYSLKSDENLYAENILGENNFFLIHLVSFQKHLYTKIFKIFCLACMHQLKGYHSQVLRQVDAVLPFMETLLKTTPRRKVFGEDLETHLTTRNVKIAVPLQFAVYGLLDHLHEEGLFRVGPSLVSLRRAKTALDACVPMREMRAQFNNPHIFTAVIKAYLRELKDPLLVSSMSDQWVATEGLKDKEKQMKQLTELVLKLPTANRDNLGFLVQFLSRLEKESEHNLMTVDNIAIVIAPNLMWGGVSVTTVVRFMIEGR